VDDDSFPLVFRAIEDVGKRLPKLNKIATHHGRLFLGLIRTSQPRTSSDVHHAIQDHDVQRAIPRQGNRKTKTARLGTDQGTQGHASRSGHARTPIASPAFVDGFALSALVLDGFALSALVFGCSLDSRVTQGHPPIAARRRDTHLLWRKLTRIC
jgi:hypothetical protein